MSSVRRSRPGRSKAGNALGDGRRSSDEGGDRGSVRCLRTRPGLERRGHARSLFFLQSDKAIRYGAAENLWGYEAIKAFRAARPAAGLARRLEKTRIVTYGRDCAITATLFRRDGAPGRIGRQMQTWIRFPEGWRIVARISASLTSLEPDPGHCPSFRGSWGWESRLRAEPHRSELIRGLEGR